MSLSNLSRSSLILRYLPKAKYCSTAALPEDEYTRTPQYPPILDLSFAKKRERKKEDVYEEVKAVKTVEEKQIKLNMPKYYGFKVNMFYENEAPYNALNLVQHCTRTHLIRSNELPQYYNDIDIESLAKDLQNQIEEAVLLETDGFMRKHDICKEELESTELEDLISSAVCRQVNRVIMNSLAHKLDHISNVQVDWDPRLESSWYVGGMNPPENVRKSRRGRPHLKEFIDEPTNRLMYYVGQPSLTLRSEVPLKPIIPYAESENPDFDVPFFKLDPRCLGYRTEYRRIVNCPGFWAGDPHTFGLLSFHKRGYIKERDDQYKELSDSKDALHIQGMLASFAWLQSQANFLGFTSYNDITYPLVTQTVITNGQTWSLYSYQLNTIMFLDKYINENPKRNICWASDEQKLYEEIKDNKLIGFNDDVLKKLLKFYANVPQERLGINLRPYLSSDEKLAADYEDPEKRVWLEREYKFLVSNRPRYRDIDEIHPWEKIYKIDNKTRFMERRMRFFERFENPAARKLNDRLPEYVPRALRPELKRHQGRYKKEFFP